MKCLKLESRNKKYRLYLLESADSGIGLTEKPIDLFTFYHPDLKHSKCKLKISFKFLKCDQTLLFSKKQIVILKKNTQNQKKKNSYI